MSTTGQITQPAPQTPRTPQTPRAAAGAAGLSGAGGAAETRMASNKRAVLQIDVSKVFNRRRVEAKIGQLSWPRIGLNALKSDVQDILEERAKNGWMIEIGGVEFGPKLFADYTAYFNATYNQRYSVKSIQQSLEPTATSSAIDGKPLYRDFLEYIFRKFFVTNEIENGADGRKWHTVLPLNFFQFINDALFISHELIASYRPKPNARSTCRLTKDEEGNLILGNFSLFYRGNEELGSLTSIYKISYVDKAWRLNTPPSYELSVPHMYSFCNFNLGYLDSKYFEKLSPHLSKEQQELFKELLETISQLQDSFFRNQLVSSFLQHNQEKGGQLAVSLERQKRSMLMGEERADWLLYNATKAILEFLREVHDIESSIWNSAVKSNQSGTTPQQILFYLDARVEQLQFRLNHYCDPNTSGIKDESQLFSSMDSCSETPTSFQELIGFYSPIQNCITRMRQQIGQQINRYLQMLEAEHRTLVDNHDSISFTTWQASKEVRSRRVFTSGLIDEENLDTEETVAAKKKQLKEYERQISANTSRRVGLLIQCAQGRHCLTSDILERIHNGGEELVIAESASARSSYCLYQELKSDDRKGSQDAAHAGDNDAVVNISFEPNLWDASLSVPAGLVPRSCARSGTRGVSNLDYVASFFADMARKCLLGARMIDSAGQAYVSPPDIEGDEREYLSIQRTMVQHGEEETKLRELGMPPSQANFVRFLTSPQGLDLAGMLGIFRHLFKNNPDGSPISYEQVTMESYLKDSNIFHQVSADIDYRRSQSGQDGGECIITYRGKIVASESNLASFNDQPLRQNVGAFVFRFSVNASNEVRVDQAEITVKTGYLASDIKKEAADLDSKYTGVFKTNVELEVITSHNPDPKLACPSGFESEAAETQSSLVSRRDKVEKQKEGQEREEMSDVAAKDKTPARPVPDGLDTVSWRGPDEESAMEYHGKSGQDKEKAVPAKSGAGSAVAGNIDAAEWLEVVDPAASIRQKLTSRLDPVSCYHISRKPILVDERGYAERRQKDLADYQEMLQKYRPDAAGDYRTLPVPPADRGAAAGAAGTGMSHMGLRQPS